MGTGIAMVANDRRWPWHLLGAFAILALTAAAYLPVFGAGYIWDDDLYVTHNPILRDPDGLWKVWTSLTAAPQFYPLVFSSFWVEVRLWGFNPAGFHAVNLALHAANAVLVWAVLARVGVRWAWVAGVVFALHPVHVESAAWIAERKNVLSGCFYLLSALAYARFDAITEPASPQRRNWSLYGLSLALFALALASKTVTCSLPAAIGLVLWWKRDRLTARDVLPLIPMLLLGLVAARTTVWVEKNHVMVNAVSLGLSWPDRLVLAGQTAGAYLWHLAWPADLVFMYPKWAVDARVWSQWLPSAAWAVLIAGLWFAHKTIGKGPLTATLYFLGTLLPALGFIDVYPMRYTWIEDHFQYLADIGPIALAAAALARLAARSGLANRRLCIAQVAVAAALGASLGALTFRQGGIYADAKTLWRDTIARNPRSWMALSNLAKELMVEGKLDEAEGYLQRSMDLEPSPECMYNLAMINLRRERPLAALEFAKRSAAAWPQKDDPQVLVANCLWTLEREPEALEALREGVKRLPESGKLRVALAQALRLMKLPGAREQAREALRLEPWNAEAKELLDTLPREPGGQGP